MKKISQTFLEFAEPLFEAMGNPLPNTEPFREALKVAHLVWNAVVLSDKQHSHDYLLDIRKSLSCHEAAPVIEALIKRKQSLFHEDLRLIGQYEVRKKTDGSYSVWAEARGNPVH